MTRLGLASASLSLTATLLVASLAPVSSAWAQTDPPPVGTDAPAVTAPPPAPPAAEPSPAPAPPPPAAAPSPLLAAPAPTAEPGTLPPLPPPDERPPIYKQAWFWGVVAVVGVTAVMIAYGLSTQGPATPSTDFGNMRAF